MINREALIADLFEIMKEADTTLTQAEIINKMVERGYAQTTVKGLFSMCVLQPFIETEKEEPIYPVLQKTKSFIGDKVHFQLHPKWEHVDKRTILQKLRCRD